MANIEHLYKRKLHEISEVIVTADNKFSDSGITTGLLGTSMFFLNYYSLYPDKNYLLLAKEYIEKVFRRVSSGAITPFIKQDLSQAGRYIEFLRSSDFLTEDSIEVLSEVDEIMEEDLNSKIEERNLDPIVGAILPGSYFLSRLSSNKTLSVYIEYLVDCIYNSRLENNDGFFWISNFQGTEVVELGISHGICGIISFLIQAYKKGIRCERSLEMISKSCAFILAHKNEYASSYFPFYAEKSKTYPIVNLCYGDIGIAYTLFSASEVLKCEELKAMSLKILIELSDKKKIENIKDANLLYGTSGLAAFYRLMYNKTGVGAFKLSSDYWYRQTLSFAIHRNSCAGFISYFNQELEHTNFCFSEGIIGIGHALMYYFNNEDFFMSFLNYYN